MGRSFGLFEVFLGAETDNAVFVLNIEPDGLAVLREIAVAGDLLAVLENADYRHGLALVCGRRFGSEVQARSCDGVGLCISSLEGTSGVGFGSGCRGCGVYLGCLAGIVRQVIIDCIWWR